jgi:hypothetical protein
LALVLALWVLIRVVARDAVAVAAVNAVAAQQASRVIG